jgi:hypothetical protein
VSIPVHRRPNGERLREGGEGLTIEGRWRGRSSSELLEEELEVSKLKPLSRWRLRKAAVVSLG